MSCDQTADVAISFDRVTKLYRLYTSDAGRILSVFPWMRANALVGERLASNDLTFRIHKGESVCLIGRNGAGKSTILKMITGVCHPSSGRVVVNGKVSALLELQAGFDSHLTGRDNLRLRATALGWTKEEIAEVEPFVVDFSELGLYIDQPLRTYSSGMRARLGFALAIARKPDILIIDETLSVGDKDFRRKCLDHIKEFMVDEQVTVLFVTHTLPQALELCTRGIVLENGQILYDGAIDDAIDFYETR